MKRERDSVTATWNMFDCKYSNGTRNIPAESSMP